MRGSAVARVGATERPGSAISMGSLASQDLAEYQDLGPFLNPDAVLQTCLRALGAANVAKRLELDWQAQNEASVSIGLCGQGGDADRLAACIVHLCTPQLSLLPSSRSSFFSVESEAACIA